MTKLKNYSLGRWKALIVAAIATAIFVQFFALRGARFETNDDSAVVRVLTQGNNSYAPFFGRVFSWVLHGLYVIIPSVNHWTVLTYAFVFLGTLALLYAVLVRYHLVEAVLINTLLLVVVWYVCLNALNFTRVATIVAVGGMALIANAVFLQEKLYKTEFGIGVGLFLLSAQIRFQCTLIALAFLGLITAVHLLKDHFRFEKAWFLAHMRTIVTMLLVAVTVLSSSVVNTLLLTKEERAYERYNTARAKIEDYPGNYDLDNWNAYAEQIGISWEDLRTFVGWISEDTEVFDIEKLEKIAVARENGGKLSALITLTRSHKRMALFLAVFFLGEVLRKPRERGISLLCCAALTAVLLSYLAINGRLPDRVFLSVLLCMSASFVLMGDDCGEGTVVFVREKLTQSICLMAAFGLLFSCAVGSLFYVRSNVKKIDAVAPQPGKGNAYAAILRNTGYDIIDEDGENIYIMPVLSAFNTVCFAFGPWDAVERDYCPNLFFLGGWDARMPHKVQALADRGIENPMRALFEMDNVYSVYDSGVLGHLKRHYNECMTASGVSGEDRLLNHIVVQYSEPIASDAIPQSIEKANLAGMSFEAVGDVDAWFLSGELTGLPEGTEALYFNVFLEGKEYSYRVGLNGLVFSAYLYDIPEDFELESAATCFVAKLSDDTYQRIKVDHN